MLVRERELVLRPGICEVCSVRRIGPELQRIGIEASLCATELVAGFRAKSGRVIVELPLGNAELVGRFGAETRCLVVELSLRKFELVPGFRSKPRRIAIQLALGKRELVFRLRAEARCVIVKLALRKRELVVRISSEPCRVVVELTLCERELVLLPGIELARPVAGAGAEGSCAVPRAGIVDARLLVCSPSAPMAQI